MNKAQQEVQRAIADLKQGRMIIVVDDLERENEGDLLMAAEFVRPEDINFMARNGRGLICQAITRERASELRLPPMVSDNTSLLSTAFSMSVDARNGTSTGISASDRATTVATLVDPQSRPNDLLRPGHIFPIVAHAGGLAGRRGHTEAGVELARMAGLYPSAVICEIMDDDGSMARASRLVELAQEWGLSLVHIKDLIAFMESNKADVGAVHRHENAEQSPNPNPEASAEQAINRATEPSLASSPRPKISIERTSETILPTSYGKFQIISYEPECYALVKGFPIKNGNTQALQQGQNPIGGEGETRTRPLVRIHSECFTGESLSSQRCDCGYQLYKAMELIENEGMGVIIYLRQEGRGIGLANKLRAYALQDSGMDTYDANIAIGMPADMRDYDIARLVLADLGISACRLLTNNPEKLEALSDLSVERVPLESEANEHNRRYLETKKQKFGHFLDLTAQ